MVFLTQRISLKQSLIGRSSVTATHDIHTAWYGLGSSILIAQRQLRMPANWLRVFIVLSYLSGITILHISTPALFSLQPFNYTVPVPASTTSTIGDYAASDIAPGEIGGNALSFVTSVGANVIGLSDGMVYAVPNHPNEAIALNVTASHFNVTCGTLDNANVSSEYHSKNWSIPGTGGWHEAGLYIFVEFPDLKGNSSTSRLDLSSAVIALYPGELFGK
jgi:hypothetical protein